MLLTGLISYWNLDEASGDAVDAHGSNDLTNVSSATYGAAKINNGVILNGSDQYLTIADGAQSGLDITGNLTLAFWINFSSYNGSTGYMPLGKADFVAADTRAYYIEFNISGSNKFDFEAGDGSSSVRQGVSWSPSTGVWYHLAVVYTTAAGSVKFYVDGVQQGATQTGFPTSIANTSAAFQIGAGLDGAQSYFINGMIDEVGVWARALSGAEITALYNSGAGLAYPFGDAPPPTTQHDAIMMAHAF